MTDNAKNTPATEPTPTAKPKPEAIVKAEASLEAIKQTIKAPSEELLNTYAANQTAHKLLMDAHAKAPETEKKALLDRANAIVEEQEALKTSIKTAKPLLENGTFKAAVDAAAKEHNPALAEGLAVRAVRELSNAHGIEFDASKHLDGVKKALGDHASLANAENVKVPYNEALKTNYLHTAAGKVAETVKPEVEKGIGKSFVAKLGREKQMLANAWNGLDSRTGEVRSLSKTKITAGGAIMLGAGALGLHDMYVGLAGENDPATGEKSKASFGKVVVGAGELAAGVLIARKLCTGAAFAR
jgi:hypothetical protein